MWTIYEEEFRVENYQFNLNNFFGFYLFFVTGLLLWHAARVIWKEAFQHWQIRVFIFVKLVHRLPCSLLVDSLAYPSLVFVSFRLALL